jgi:hypothetical protein
MQDRIYRIVEILLAPHGRTIHWVNRVGLTMSESLPLFPR